MSPSIIDASDAVKWVVPEPGSQKALGVRITHELFAPEPIIPETANILWKKQRKGELSHAEAIVAAELLAGGGVNYMSMRELLIPATKLAIVLNHPAYDCVYLAAAMQLGCPLLTADAKLIEKLHQQKFTRVVCCDLETFPIL